MPKVKLNTGGRSASTASSCTSKGFDGTGGSIGGGGLGSGSLSSLTGGILGGSSSTGGLGGSTTGRTTGATGGASGSQTYGNATVAGGRVFVGTNNGNPRNARDKDKDGKRIDKGVLMCFEEATGKFLWQAVYDKLPAGRVNDWPDEGICSSPVV